MLVAHGILHLIGWDHDTKAKDVADARKETAKLVAAAVAGDAKRPSGRKIFRPSSPSKAQRRTG